MSYKNQDRQRNARPPGALKQKPHHKAFADGLRKGRDERDAEVKKLKAALDKALEENLALREAAKPQA